MIESQKAAAERFRNLHRQAEPFLLPNPGDAGTARLLEQAGFQALATSSAAAAFAMGLADGSVSRPAMMRHIEDIAASTRLPVSADLGDGFARDPETVAETIRLAACSGAVGGSIEDRSGDPKSPLLPLSLSVERVAAAVAAARALPFPFTLTARTEHFLVGTCDLDDVVNRLEAYRKAGADVLYAPGLPDDDAILAAVKAASPCPLNVLAQGSGVASSFAHLASLGVRRISIGSGLSRIAFAAIAAALEELKTGNFKVLDTAIPLAVMNARFSARANPETMD